MKCPYCAVEIHKGLETVPLFQVERDEKDDDIGNAILSADNLMGWEVAHQECPACHEQIIWLRTGTSAYKFERGGHQFSGVDEDHDYTEVMVWPKNGSRPVPPHVPSSLKEDFDEAVAVLPFSPKASAALTRRALQHLLTEYAGGKGKNLAQQIQSVIDSNTLSSDLSSQLDAVRSIGNFAAHPLKDTNSGEIIPVEPDEAEWNLEVLEELFDHYFVRPARILERKKKFNQKLDQAGKQSLG